MKGWIDIHVHDEATGETRSTRWDNIITAAGVAYYTSRIVGATPSEFVDGGGAFDGILELGTAGTTPTSTSTRAAVTTKVASSQLAVDATYPRTDDPDSRNPLAGQVMLGTTASVQLEQTVTYRFTYPVGTFTGTNIDRAIITNPSPGASEAVMCYSTGTAFTVTSTSSVTIIWNHRFQRAN